MLEMQNKVFEETQRLQEITGEQATRQIEIRASNLAGQERKILDEGRRAFLLLREEGSSAAFPEAMEQVNTDIGNVAERLAQADIGKLTTTIEQEIISSLEEMVGALVQVQKEQKEKKQKQQGQPQQGEPGEQPLVDKLAELRLIRTLQVRINNRTTSLSQMLADPADVIGQAKEADILKEVKGLAERQASIQHVTREIVVGADK
jgi:monoamine oxidase